MRYLAFVLLMLAMACSSENERCNNAPDLGNIDIELNIQRLDREMFALKNAQEVTAFMNHNPVFAEIFLSRPAYPNDTVLANQVLRLIADPHIKDTLYQEVQTTFNDEYVYDTFEKAFKTIKYYYPEYRLPKIQLGITGMANDLYVSDSLIIVGLDFFLGPKASYRPIGIPDYILRRYTPEHLLPSVMLFVSQGFNKANDTDKTMLADMAYYGKSYYFMQTILPCTPDSLLIGFSAEELKDTEEHADIVWANFIQNKLIYETNYQIKSKFLGERPKVVEIGSKCPGRIGMWVGWQIINQYVEKRPNTTLPELMKNTNAQEIFNESKYKPRTR